MKKIQSNAGMLLINRDYWVKNNRLQTVFLITFITFLASSTLYWLKMNSAPPAWDQSWYLQTSEMFYHALNGHALNEFWDLYTHSFSGIKAPLISLLPLPFYFLVGHGMNGVIWTQVCLVIFFCLIYYKLVSELADSLTALVAVIITNTMPLTFGMARNFLVEYGIMLLVTLWIYIQLHSLQFRKLFYNIILGFTLGLGLLMKVSFPLFIIGPVFLDVFVRLKAQGFKWRNGLNTFKDLLVIVLIGSVIASSWYLPNLSKVLQFAFSTSFGTLSVDYSMGNPLSYESILKYLQLVVNHAVSVYYAGFLIGLSIPSIIKLFLAKKSFFNRRSMPLFSWILIPLFVFSLSNNKDFKYILPVLPALGAGTSMMLAGLLPKTFLKSGIIALTLVLPVSLFILYTFPLLPDWRCTNRNWILYIPDLNGYTHLPDQTSWPQLEIINAIEADAKAHFDSTLPSRPVIMLIADHISFNQNNFSYYASYQNSPLIFSAVLTKTEGDWQQSRKDYLLTGDYLLTKTGDQGPSFTTYMNASIRQMLAAQELPYVKIAEFALPDGSESDLYRKIQPTSP